MSVGCVGVAVLGTCAVAREAIGAPTLESCVAGLEREAMGVAHGCGELSEQVFGDVDDGAALVADEMNVAALTQLVERSAGSYVDMLDDVEFVEAAQNAVDG